MGVTRVHPVGWERAGFAASERKARHEVAGHHVAVERQFVEPVQEQLELVGREGFALRFMQAGRLHRVDGVHRKLAIRNGLRHDRVEHLPVLRDRGSLHGVAAGGVLLQPKERFAACLRVDLVHAHRAEGRSAQGVHGNALHEHRVRRVFAAFLTPAVPGLRVRLERVRHGQERLKLVHEGAQGVLGFGPRSSEAAGLPAELRRGPKAPFAAAGARLVLLQLLDGRARDPHRAPSFSEATAIDRATSMKARRCAGSILR